MKKGLLELLKDGPVIGDGSYVITLEKRGYITMGLWTPECVLENPQAVEQLHRDYIRAGSDVIQSFTFYCEENRMKTYHGASFKDVDLNEKACDITLKIANEADRPVLVAGGLSNCPEKPGKIEKQAAFKKQIDVFRAKKVDFLLAEFMPTVEEAVWAVEMMVGHGIPVGATVRIGPAGDDNDVTPGECAIMMAKAGANLVGINCQYDPNTCLKTLEMMKAALIKAGYWDKPLGYHCPEVENMKDGYMHLPENPLQLEPRLITRHDARNFARRAVNLGVRYIGGCCGIEPYHMREIAMELKADRGGRDPPGAYQNPEFGAKLQTWESTTTDLHANNLQSNQFTFSSYTPQSLSDSSIKTRTTREYWNAITKKQKYFVPPVE